MKRSRSVSKPDNSLPDCFRPGQAPIRYTHGWQRPRRLGRLDRLPIKDATASSSTDKTGWHLTIDCSGRKHVGRHSEILGDQSMKPSGRIHPGRHMHTHIELGGPEGSSWISTGHLPPPELVRDLADEAYSRYRSDNEGAVADYIPALARTPSHLFGLCVVGVSQRRQSTPCTASACWRFWRTAGLSELSARLAV
jgi:hypothetical protein